MLIPVSLLSAMAAKMFGSIDSLSFILISVVMCIQVTDAIVWKNQAVLDSRGDYQVFWDWDEQNITFEVQVRTKGYVGFGFSSNGGMKGADIVIGWVKDNEVHLQDRHAIGNSEPLIDEHQDYELLSGFENETHTVLRFTRKKDTCDEQDFEITKETMHLIYAWRSEDPVSNTSRLQYHGSRNRGAKSVRMYDKKFNKFDFTDDVFTWNMTMPEITVPAMDTSYICKYFKFPAQQNKHHRVGLDVVIQPGNENVVHHVVLYQCKEQMSSSLESKLNDPSFLCVDDTAFMSLCPTMIASRPLGKEGEALPSHIGVPFGHTDKPTYFMLQTHFSNPELRNDIVDQTTMRMYITEKLRPNDGGTIYLRVEKLYPLIIPPKQPSFTYLVVGPPQCTQLLPDTGINLYSVSFHMHLTGRKGFARHFRDGVELPLIAEDKFFDFNYQQPTVLSEEVTVLPGDLLAAQCEYDTLDRRNLTLGGSKSTNEMCTLMLYYYPLSNLSMCKATGSAKELLQIFNIEEMSPDNIHIKLPEELANVSLIEYLGNFDVTNLIDDDVADIQRLQIQNPIMAGKCVTQDNLMIPYSMERPNYTFVPHVSPPRSCDSSHFS